MVEGVKGTKIKNRSKIISLLALCLAGISSLIIIFFILWVNGMEKTAIVSWLSERSVRYFSYTTDPKKETN